MNQKDASKALYQAGRMSNALDKLRAALNGEQANLAGLAVAQLVDAKCKYDRAIEEMSKDA